MTNKEKIDFYKELFNKEDTRRIEIYTSLNIPIAAFSGLVSFMYYMISKFNYSQEDFLTFIFVGLIIVLGVFLMISLMYIIKAYVNLFHKYQYPNISYAEKLVEYNKSLVNYYTQYANSPDKGEVEFENYLIQKYARLADDNYYTNEVRSKHVYWGKQFLVISIIISVLCIVPFAYNKIKQTHSQTISKKLSIDGYSVKMDSTLYKEFINFLSNHNNTKNENIISIYYQSSCRPIKSKGTLIYDTNIIVVDTCIKIFKKK